MPRFNWFTSISVKCFFYHFPYPCVKVLHFLWIPCLLCIKNLNWLDQIVVNYLIALHNSWFFSHYLIPLLRHIYIVNMAHGILVEHFLAIISAENLLSINCVAAQDGGCQLWRASLMVWSQFTRICFTFDLDESHSLKSWCIYCSFTFFPFLYLYNYTNL